MNMTLRKSGKILDLNRTKETEFLFEELRNSEKDGKEIVSIVKLITSKLAESYKNHEFEKFKRFVMKEIANEISNIKDSKKSIFDILEESAKLLRFDSNSIRINKVPFVEGDYVVIKDNNTISSLVISKIQDNSITIQNTNDIEDCKTLSVSEFKDIVDLDISQKLKCLSIPLKLSSGDALIIGEEIKNALDVLARNIKDDCLKEKFSTNCIDKLQCYNEDLHRTIMDIVSVEWKSLNLDKDTVSIGDRHFYIGSYVSLKGEPNLHNIIIKNITDEEVYLEHKFIKSKFSTRMNRSEFYNKVFLFSDVFEESKETVEWSDSIYSSEMLSMLLSEGVLRLNDEKGAKFNIKNNPSAYVKDIEIVLKDRVSDVDESVISEHYISNCLNLINNKSISNSFCKNRSLMDSLDAIWENMNVSQQVFSIDKKTYKVGDFIAMKGYNGVQKFKIDSITPGAIVISTLYKDESIVKTYPSVNELKKNVWLLSDIKHMELKYINYMSELPFEKILDMKHVIENMDSNIDLSSDSLYINNLIDKLDCEVKERVLLYSCLLNKTDYMLYICEAIKNSSVYKDNLELISNKSKFTSLLKEMTINHVEKLEGIILGEIYNNPNNFVFKDTRGKEYKFSYSAVYTMLTKEELTDDFKNEDVNECSVEEIRVVPKEILTPMDESHSIDLDVKNKDIISDISEVSIEEVEIEEIPSNNINTNDNISKEKDTLKISKNELFESIAQHIYDKNKSYFDSAIFSKKNTIKLYLENIINNKKEFTSALMGEGKIHIDIDRKYLFFNVEGYDEFKISLNSFINKLKKKQEAKVEQFSFFDLI